MHSDLTAGSLILGYRIKRTLGQGRLGMVYLAEHERLGRPAVLRVIAPGLLPPDRFDRLLAHAIRLARVDHPGILNIYDAAKSDDGTLFLATRYAAGGDLRSTLLQDGAMPERRAAEMAMAVAEALATLHAASMTHGSVSPRSIFCDRDPAGREQWCLSDFGAGSAADLSSPDVSSADRPAGAYDYLAPEQVRGETLRQSDLYGLGCVLHHCLVGSPPFTGTDALVAAAHLHEPAPPPSKARPDLDPRIDRVVARALAKDPRDRYPSAKAMAEALSELAVPVEAPLQPPTGRRRPALLIGAVALAVAAICAVVVTIVLEGRGSTARPAPPVVRPSGTLAFSLVREPNSQVATVSARGGVQSVLTSGSAPAWSPDGRFIVLLHHLKMTLTDRSGRNPRILTDAQINTGFGADRLYSKVFAWSPDGKRIAYTYFQRNGEGALATMSPDGRDIRTIASDCVNQDTVTTASYGECSRQPLHGFCKPVKHQAVPLLCQPLYMWAPDWSRSGRRIVFTAGSGENPRSNLYVVNADGSGLHRLHVVLPARFASPADGVWSPTARSIAFDTCDVAYTVCAIFTVGADGGRAHQQRLAPYEAQWDPTWSPDGRFMTFICEQNNINSICEADADGTHLHRVVKGAKEPQPAGVTWGR